MDVAEKTWALVVGIDQYDHPSIPQLDGAVADAIAAVRWLRQLGVPYEQILLHVAPSDISRRALETLQNEAREDGHQLLVHDAYENTIWTKSIMRLMDVKDALRLFVFLSGHGLCPFDDGSLFLTQEFEYPGNPNNLGINWYLDLFMGMNFPRQFLFMDGCQNRPYDQDQRKRIRAGQHGGYEIQPVTPRNSMIACLAASPGEVAVEIAGHGLFLRRVLEALDLTHPSRFAEMLNFETGVRTVDLVRAMVKDIQGQVEKEARNANPPTEQRPRMMFKPDATESAGPIPIIRLEDLPTCEVTIEALPSDGVSAQDAVAAVESVHIEFKTKPYWQENLPRTASDRPPLPFVARLPASMPVEVECFVRDGAPFVTDPTKTLIDTDEMTKRIAFRVGSAPTILAVKTEHRDGKEWLWGATYQQWTAAARAARFHIYPNGEYFPTVERQPWHTLHGSDIGNGLTLQVHETGPRFLVPGDRQAFSGEGLLIARLAEEIRKIAGPEVTITATLPVADAERQPNLRLRLPRGGAGSLAGALANVPVLSLRPVSAPIEQSLWRGGGDLSLQQVEQTPAIRCAPGASRIQLDLPWGSWTEIVSIPRIGQVAVELPESVGIPPLRLALYRKSGRRQDHTAAAHIVGVHGEERKGRALRGLLTQEQVELKAIKPSRPAAWTLAAPDEVSTSPSRTRWLAAIEGDSRAVFPFYGARTLAVEWSERVLVVEPLSDVSAPEWDALVARGRLDALTAEECLKLVMRTKDTDELLRLAAAYSAYATWAYAVAANPTSDAAKAARRHLDAILQRVMEPLSDAGADVVDIDLLGIAREAKEGGRLSEEAVAVLRKRAQGGEAPVFRWGVVLALRLLDLLENADLADLNIWRNALRRVERRMSLVSIWTAWTENTPG